MVKGRYAYTPFSAGVIYSSERTIPVPLCAESGGHDADAWVAVQGVPLQGASR